MILIWRQDPYEPGFDYRLAADRQTAARIVREMRKERRILDMGESYTKAGYQRFVFTWSVCTMEIEPEGVLVS